MKTTFSIIQKHPEYKTANYYLRMRRDGKAVDVRLDTADRAEAEAELLRVKLAQHELESKGIDGDPLDALTVRRKQAQESVLAPGGILERWEAKMALEGLRASSVARYARALRVLLKGVAPEYLTPASVSTIMARTANLKPATRRSYANALASLFRYMKRHDLVEALPKIKVDQADRPWWTREEMNEIILNVTSTSAERVLEYRDYFGIMAAVGSRQSETYALRWRDLREDGTVVFRADTTKSRKERIVPLPTYLWGQLESRRGEPDEIMFPSIGRDQATRFEVLARALRKLGLRGGLHTFRHSVSMLLYKKSGDIKAVSQLLGHSPQVALQYYQNTRGVEELRSLVED